ncbi:MAG: metallophosphoesterase family protein [Gemmataceae bacterium]
MRILVVSDLHANPAALAAITEPFDACVCMGDLVEYGPDHGPVFDWVRKHVTVCVRGNHDHGAAQGVSVQGVSGFRYLTMATRETTARTLSAADRRFLADLPTMAMVTLGGLRFLVVHASPRDPLDEYVYPDPAAWEPRLKGFPVDFVCVGHTHTQYSLPVGRVTVVNPGSVGLSRDGDPRVRYAVIDDGKVELKQVAYDVDATVAAVGRTDLPLLAKSMLTDIYRGGRYVHPPGLPVPVHKAGTYRNGNGHVNGNGNGHHLSNGLAASARQSV